MGNGNQTKDESQKLLSRRTWARLYEKNPFVNLPGTSHPQLVTDGFFCESSGEVNRTAPLLGQLAPHGTL